MASGSEKKKDKTKIKGNTPAKERGKRMKMANQKTLSNSKKKWAVSFHFKTILMKAKKKLHKE
jgi:hypothetical protein